MSSAGPETATTTPSEQQPPLDQATKPADPVLDRGLEQKVRREERRREGTNAFALLSRLLPHTPPQLIASGDRDR